MVKRLGAASGYLQSIHQDSRNSGGGDSNSSPYQTTYNWSGAVAASGSQTTTAYNNANLTNTNTFTITPDTTAPTGGALTVNGTNATGAGSTSYNSSGSWTIGTITDYTDSGSGLTSSVLTRQSATLSSSNGIAAGSCGSFGSATTIGSRSTPIAQTLDRPHLLPLHAHRHSTTSATPSPSPPPSRSTRPARRRRR